MRLRAAVVIAVALVAGALLVPAEAQNRAWVSVNGAMFGSFADGSASAPSIAFANETGLGIFRPATTIMRFMRGGSNAMDVGAPAVGVSLRLYNGGIDFAADAASDIGASGANRPRNLYLGSSIKQVGGITTSGVVGTPAIVATGRATAQTAANSSVSTFTVGAADGSFIVSANVLVTTATTHAFTLECAYTDEGNTARVATLSFEQLAGTFTTSVANANGAVPYEGVPLHIRAKAATTITIRTQAAGTYTSVVYNAEGIIQQVS